VMIEEQSGTLALLPTHEWGGEGTVASKIDRNTFSFAIKQTVHDDLVSAADIQDVRGFGTEQLASMSAETALRLQRMRARHDITLEYKRMGALKGNVLNADGSSSLANLFTTFGISQVTVDFVLGTAVTRRIKMAILGQTLTSGTDGGSGNRALGQVHNEVRLEKKQADSKMITQTVQRMADTLAALNGMEPPTFIMEDGSGLEIDRANRDKILVDAGMVKFTSDYIKDKYDLLDTDFTVPEPPAQLQPQNQQPNQPVAPVDKAPAAMSKAAPFKFVDGQHDHRPRFTAGQQAIEDQIDNTLANFISPITHKAIASAIAGATSPEDLIERLGVALQDSSDVQFRQTLERALFAADLMGYGQAQKQQA